MKLSTTPIEHVAHAARHYVRLKEVFAAFAAQATILETPQSPIKGGRLVFSQESNCLDVFVVGMQLRFLFLLCYGEDRSPRGRIVCLREAPRVSETKDIVGCFTFSTDGIADIEVTDGDEKIELEYHAIKIIAYFVDKAVAMPPFPPTA